MKFYICETLSKMPEEVISYITANCWFLSSMEDAWAFTFTGYDVVNQHLIFLSDELLVQEYEQIQHTIAHEIGHVILGHKNSVLINQTKREVQQQEHEADVFVQKYFS